MSLRLSLDVSAVPTRPGGAGYYTIELARALMARRELDLTLVARRDDAERWARLGDETPATTRAVVPKARPGRLLFEQIGFPRLLRRAGVQVHHGPHYTMPERASVPCVVTIHDLTFFDHPEWHVRSKALLFRRAIRRAARDAAALICVSEVTAARLRARCQVRAPIVVAPHGVDHERFTPIEPAAGSDRGALLAIGVPVDRPLVVFVGTLEPRKGVATLVAAFDQVAARHRDAVLVLGGQMGWGLDDTEHALAAARHREQIVLTGYLPDPAVPALLRQAAVVAYPALEEGFGLPALEALACGAPLITTEGTAMAELAQGTARLVRPGDALMLAETLEEALGGSNGDPAAGERRAGGLAVAAARTWAASASRHLEAYQIALAASQ